MARRVTRAQAGLQERRRRTERAWMRAALQGFKTTPDDTLKSAGGTSQRLHRGRLALKCHREGLGHRTPRGGPQCLKPSPPVPWPRPGFGAMPLAAPRPGGLLPTHNRWAWGGVFPKEL